MHDVAATHGDVVLAQAAGALGLCLPVKNLLKEGIGIWFELAVREGHHIAVLSDDNDQRSCLRYLHDSCVNCNRNHEVLG
ncbi:hypothetical protein [Paeniglutamicibacter sulfureus]|uniref:Uncharacterized protein n=1 Tax=Paeniglutamicibacter sulfureus TaxID=43666 RepID=A0ABU2BIV1_9MICC|nr:hypothetical protein [Paeniglutamicibacter sulfureus]MDO2934370.1 hypothetical protein [Paeniglutamicibacter sulfureus]MDR7358568.1 hypothetical protein [Paeniglutamicibacter sulfureus]